VDQRKVTGFLSVRVILSLMAYRSNTFIHFIYCMSARDLKFSQRELKAGGWNSCISLHNSLKIFFSHSFALTSPCLSVLSCYDTHKLKIMCFQRNKRNYRYTNNFYSSFSTVFSTFNNVKISLLSWRVTVNEKWDVSEFIKRVFFLLIFFKALLCLFLFIYLFIVWGRERQDWFKKR
jgi:hypothetical protein